MTPLLGYTPEVSETAAGEEPTAPEEGVSHEFGALNTLLLVLVLGNDDGEGERTENA